MTPRLLRSPLFWLGLALTLALVAALVLSDGLADLARFSAEYQVRIQRTLSTSLQDVKSGSGSLALWGLLVVCFGYGVVHTLGPGHGKSVVVAYFLDGSHRRGWIEGVLAGTWIAITHTVAALVLAAILKLAFSSSLFGALREMRNVEIVSYTLVLAIGIWRLWAGLTGNLHHHDHGHDHGHDHEHAHHGPPPRSVSGWLLLTAAGIAPCAGAIIVVLLSAAMGVLWAGVLGVAAIAVGMALTLAAIGLASMMAHRLIIADGRARDFGRITVVGASLIVVATAGTLLLGALERLFL